LARHLAAPTIFLLARFQLSGSQPVDQAAEHQWVRQAQAGDKQAFAALVDLYWPRIYRWLFNLTRNSHTAEDLTQEVFLKAWAGLPGFQGVVGFRSWLFRIANNRLIDTRRGPRGIAPDRLPESLAISDPGPVATVLSRESQTLLQEACTRLPTKLRAAFLLRTQEELSFEEIGQVLGVGEETVRWRVFKARHLLLDELKPYLDEKSP
jgi:RNA polymerase sigma-70 factor (ECF subfamily)